MYNIDEQTINANSPIDAIDQSFNGLRQQIEQYIKSNILLLKSKNISPQLAFSEFIINHYSEYKQWKKIVSSIIKQWLNRHPQNEIVEGLLTYNLYAEVNGIFNKVWKFTPDLKKSFDLYRGT